MSLRLFAHSAFTESELYELLNNDQALHREKMPPFLQAEKNIVTFGSKNFTVLKEMIRKEITNNYMTDFKKNDKSLAESVIKNGEINDIGVTKA